MNLDKELRRHDAAAIVTTDLSQSPRAQATLARVTQGAPGGATRPSIRQRRTRYSLAAAVAAAAVVIAPVLGGGTAFADWTAKARAATPQEEAQWGETCQAWMSEVNDGIRHGFRTRLVEMRGTWALSYLTAPDGYEALCLNATRSIDAQALTAPLTEAAPPDGLVTNSVSKAEFDSGNTYMVSGKVGSNVRSVTFDAGGVDVEATVQDGYFVAWWPERKPDSLLKRLTQYGPPNPGVRITLTDGSNRVQPIQDFDTSPM